MRSCEPRVRELTARIVVGTGYPYWAGREIFGLGMGLHTESGIGLHLMGALTDWVELRRQEQTQAESRMREAAAEWPTAEHDPGAEAITRSDPRLIAAQGLMP